MRPVSICPRCGARLAQRNLQHSCGTFTLEALFARSAPGVLELARRYVDVLRSLGDVQILPQKTRLVAVARVRFAGLVPRRRDLVANFALDRRLGSRRIARVVDYGPRWQRHELVIASPADLDDELRAWLQESHDRVGMR